MAEQAPLKRSYILIALMMTMALAAMDDTIVSTAIPQIVSDLGGFKKFSWVFAIYLLAQTVTIPIYGKLSDMFGRKKILLFGIVVFLVGSAASAAAWNINALVVFRGVEGLGAGSIMATVNTIAGDIYKIEERAKIQGWLSSIWGISALVGPALGGALAKYISWRWIFLINIPIGIVSMLLIGVYFKEKIKPHKHKIDYLGATLILLTVGLLIVYLLKGGQRWPWLSGSGLAFIAAIIFLALITVWVEKKAGGNAVMPGWVWRNKTLAFVNIAVVFMGMTMMGPNTFLPTFSQASLGIGIIASGFILATMSIGWPTASALSGKLYMKIGFRNTALIGTVVVAMACAGFLFLPWPQPVALIVADQILMGAGFGLLSTASMVGIQNMVDWHRRGVVTGLNMFCRNLGQSLGAAIIGAIFNNAYQLQMKKAKPQWQENLSDILNVMKNPGLAADKKLFLEKAISNATVDIYIGLTCFAVVMFIFMAIVPAKFKKLTPDTP